MIDLPVGKGQPRAMHKHPKDTERSPDRPFESENVSAEEAARLLKEERRSSGDLPDSSAEEPVKDSHPYKGLTG